MELTIDFDKARELLAGRYLPAVIVFAVLLKLYLTVRFFIACPTAWNVFEAAFVRAVSSPICWGLCLVACVAGMCHGGFSDPPPFGTFLCLIGSMASLGGVVISSIAKIPD